MYSDDDDAEPAIPLLLGDKQGRSLSGDEVQGSSKSDESVNRDRYQDLPEWVPEFYPSDPAKDEVVPKKHPDETAEGVDSKPSQLSSPVRNEGPVSFTLRKSDQVSAIMECLSSVPRNMQII